MLSSGGLGCLTMSAYGQFGYSYPSASQLLVAGQGSTGASPPLISPGSSSVAPGGVSPNSNSAPAGGSTGSGTSCCDTGRPLITDPVSGQTVCSCQYDSARLALSSYPRLSAPGVYGTPYPSTDQNPYPSIGVDSSAFYSPLSNPYGLKDSGSSADMSAWTSAGLQTTTGYYPYDPTLAAYGYGAAGYDLAARRKNATRESTATLKAWLNEHKKNPYPTKGEKIMLAIITKMTLTQVSTWFANARRRLKKENKMTWEPKNKTDDDDEAVVSDADSKEKDDMSFDGDKVKDRLRDDKDPLTRVKLESRHDKDLDDDDDLDDDIKDEDLMGHHHSQHMHLGHHGHAGHHMIPCLKDELKNDCGIPIPATKPKIWSLADTAACKTPPPPTAQPWPASGGNFALPNSAMSPATPSAPYSRYSGFLGHYNNTFPEVQTDTPPQTPPNMKLPNLVNSNACVQQGNQNGYQQGFPNAYARMPHQQQSMGGISPHSKERQEFPMQSNMRHNALNTQHQQHQTSHHNNNNNNPESTAFKPFFKGSPPMSNGFVSPV